MADGSRHLQLRPFRKNPFGHLLLRCSLQSYLLKQMGGRKGGTKGGWHATFSLKILTVALNGGRLGEEKHRKRDGERERTTSCAWADESPVCNLRRKGSATPERSVRKQETARKNFTLSGWMMQDTGTLSRVKAISWGSCTDWGRLGFVFCFFSVFAEIGSLVVRLRAKPDAGVNYPTQGVKHPAELNLIARCGSLISSLFHLGEGWRTDAPLWYQSIKKFTNMNICIFGNV